MRINLACDTFDPALDRLFAALGSKVYWQSGNQLRRGVVSAGVLNEAPALGGLDGAVDRLFAANGRVIYWQRGSQLRRGVVSGGSITVDLVFEGFDGSVDRLFAANGNTVYWQAGNQLRRGSIVDGTLTVDLSFDGFNGAVDRLFAANGNAVYWQAGNQLRRGSIVNGSLTVDLSFDGFDGAVDRLFAADGATVYWQAGKQLRRAILADFPENQVATRREYIQIAPTLAPSQQLKQHVLPKLLRFPAIQARHPRSPFRPLTENAAALNRREARLRAVAFLDLVGPILDALNVYYGMLAQGAPPGELAAVNLPPPAAPGVTLEELQNAFAAERVGYIEIIKRDIGPGETDDQVIRHAFEGYDGVALDLRAIFELVAGGAERDFRLSLLNAETALANAQRQQAILLYEALLTATAPETPERKYVAARSAFARLSLGDELFRKRAQSKDSRRAISEVYNAAVRDLQTHLVSSDNPLRKQAEHHVQQRQMMLQSDLNHLGLWEGFVPVQTFSVLEKVALQQISAAKQEAADFVQFRQQQDLLQVEEAELAFQESEERITLDVLNLKAENSTLGIDKLDVQLHSITEQLGALDQISSLAAGAGAAIMQAVVTGMQTRNDSVGSVQGLVGLLGVGVNARAQLEQLEQQRQTAQIERDIASNDEQIAALEASKSEHRLDFLGEKRALLGQRLMNHDFLAILVDSSEQRAEQLLDAAIYFSYLYERAVAWFLGEPQIRHIRFDYLADREGIVKAASNLEKDFNAVGAEIGNRKEKVDFFFEKISLREEYPVEFHRFLQTGQMDFTYSLYQLSCKRPASHQCRLHGERPVTVTIEGNLPPTGFSGLLTHSGQFLVRDKKATLDGATRLIPTAEQLEQALAEQRERGLAVAAVGGVLYYDLDRDRHELNVDMGPIVSRPAEPLSLTLFEGRAPTGLWKLSIQDHFRLQISNVFVTFSIISRESDDVELQPKVEELIRSYEAELADGDALDKFSAFSLRDSFNDAFQALESGFAECFLGEEFFLEGLANLQFKAVIVQTIDRNKKGVPGVGIQIRRPEFAIDAETRADGFSVDLDAPIPTLPRGERFPVLGTWRLRLTDPSQFAQLGDVRLFFLYSFQHA